MLKLICFRKAIDFCVDIKIITSYKNHKSIITKLDVDVSIFKRVFKSIKENRFQRTIIPADKIERKKGKSKSFFYIISVTRKNVAA